MRLIKLSLATLLSASALACAAETDGAGTGGAGPGVGTGGASATGGTTGTTGGTTGATGGTTGATGGTSAGTGGSTSSGPTYLGQADAGITTLGVSVAKDAGGSSITMSKGTNPGEVCFSGSTPAVTNWATQWGMSISFDLAAANASWDGSAATNVNYGVSGTAPTLMVGLQDAVTFAPESTTDKLTFGAQASTGAAQSTAISSLAQPAWTLDAEGYGMKTLDKSQLTAIVFYISADVAAKSFDFCLTDPTVDGFAAP